MKRIERLIRSLLLLCLVMACWTQHRVCQGQSPAPLADADIVQHRYQSAGAPVSVTAEIVSANPQVADPIEYRIMVDAPIGTTVVLPPVLATIGDESLGRTPLDQPFADFLLTGIQISRDIPIDAKTSWRRTQLTLQIESLQSGLCRAPALEVAYQISGAAPQPSDAVTTGDQKVVGRKPGAQGTINIPALGVEVASVLVASDSPDKYRDIKTAVATPASEPAATLSPLIWFAGGALSLVLLGLGCYWLRQNRIPKADRWALQRIAELERAYADERVAAVEVYNALSAVLRDYLESARQTPATALSTEEFLEVLKRNHFETSVIAGARTILSQSDASKFAPKSVASIGVNPSPFDHARAIVEESIRLQTESRQKQRQTGLAAVQPSPDLARKAEA
ncbi:MAG: DUF4381 family protein [Rubripirellula sp.]|nr:DUF4381 family protein [Rubripirellula sp.]